MELRKDPITRSWVVVGAPEEAPQPTAGCPFCPGQESAQPTLLTLPPQGPWQVRVLPHLNPLYRIEGEPARSADGIYDRMRLLARTKSSSKRPPTKRLSRASPTTTSSAS